MAAVILALAALVLSVLGLCVAWMALGAANQAHGLADEALDSVALLALQPDAILTTEDGEEIAFRMDRGH